MQNDEQKNTCAMCGKKINEPKNQVLVEKIDDTNYVFDSEDCALFFKKFKSLYGNNFT
jgi:hypothetical protein